jgi:hypothetical protein
VGTKPAVMLVFFMFVSLGFKMDFMFFIKSIFSSTCKKAKHHANCCDELSTIDSNLKID